MNRPRKILNTIFCAAVLAIAPSLFSLAGLSSGIVATANAQGTWRLKEIKVFRPKTTQYMTITSESYDRNGGNVELVVRGEALDLCPGGQEKMRFTWRFPNGISEFVNGNAVTANLEAGVLSFQKPCSGHNIASFSALSIYGSKGQYSPLSPEENKLIDGEKFLNLDDLYWVAPSDYRQTSVTRVGVKEWPNNPKSPLAWFDIKVTTRAGDVLQYVYIYELSGAGGGNPTFTIENDIDRMGGDYKDFDLPQANPGMCQQACANDSNCRAFSYVAPGIQAPGARCWLKSSVPGASRKAGVITGVKN